MVLVAGGIGGTPLLSIAAQFALTGCVEPLPCRRGLVGLLDACGGKAQAPAAAAAAAAPAGPAQQSPAAGDLEQAGGAWTGGAAGAWCQRYPLLLL